MKEEDLPDDLQAVVRKILRYLVEHPDAKDAPEGILRFWLQGEAGERAVRNALDFLVLKGWIVGRETPSSDRIYGINRERLREIGTFLNGFTS
ncbi:MAG: hypothetical protein WAO55_11310 [Candidatus Manganitrophaceae bacterium]